MILCVYAGIVVYPMFWMMATSLKTSLAIFEGPWSLPAHPQFMNYANAWRAGALGHKLITSVVVTICTVLIVLALASMTAYVLGRFRFTGRVFLNYLFLAGMGLPVFLGIIPLFMLMNRLGLYDSIAGLVVVYVAFSLPFAVFVLTGFFKTLPLALAEAAYMDGAKPFAVFWRVMLPLARPGLVTVGIFVFISIWNEYPLALVLLLKPEHQTLPLGIANLTMTQRYQSDWGALFASLSIGVLPTVFVYALLQRQIQEGLIAGAIK
jgi:N-acetylglucosamine transport system permease protein